MTDARRPGYGSRVEGRMMAETMTIDEPRPLRPCSNKAKALTEAWPTQQTFRANYPFRFSLSVIMGSGPDHGSLDRKLSSRTARPVR